MGSKYSSEDGSMKFYRLAFALCVISFALLTAGCNSTQNNPNESTPEKPASGAPPQRKEAVLYTGHKAFEITLQHGGEGILKKNAQQPITYLLLKDRKQNVPVWYVIYGISEKDRKGISVINATTGAFVSAGK